jgi:hypothetical protein
LIHSDVITLAWSKSANAGLNENPYLPAMIPYSGRSVFRNEHGLGIAVLALLELLFLRELKLRGSASPLRAAGGHLLTATSDNCGGSLISSKGRLGIPVTIPDDITGERCNSATIRIETLTWCIQQGVMMLSKITVSISASAIAVLALLASDATPAGAQTGTWTDFGGPGVAPAFPGNGNTGNPAGQVPAAVRGPGTALLLTDGSVIMHDTCTEHWFRLLPRSDGTFANSYINGQWSATAIADNASIAQMIGLGAAPDFYGPLFFSSVVLPDGRVVVQGGEGEYSTGTCSTNPAADSTKGSLFDPNANSWTSVPPPAPGGTAWTTIGDAMGILLGVNRITGSYSQANYMVQNCCQTTPNPNPPPALLFTNQASQQAVASITPRPGTTFTWTVMGPGTTIPTGKATVNDEEGWVRLPTGQLLNVQACVGQGAVNCTGTEVFDPATQTWSTAGTTPVTLVDANKELGPGVSIGYNMVVWFGATNAIALFTGRAASNPPNTWIAQTPFVPAAQSMADAPASLLPSGNILVQTGPGFNTTPSSFFEFNSSTLSPQNTGPVGATATVNQPQCPAGAGANTTNIASFQGRMVLLPTGQVLWDAGEGVNCTSIYTSNNNVDPNPVMRPLPHINFVNNFPSTSAITLTRGSLNNTLTGNMFRGVSQGASYGDDAQSATDFPIVMITNNATQHRCFGRTHDWAIHAAAQFDIPPDNTPQPGWALVEHNCETGPSTLQVIVNSKVSNSFAVTIN